MHELQEAVLKGGEEAEALLALFAQMKADKAADEARQDTSLDDLIDMANTQEAAGFDEVEDTPTSDEPEFETGSEDDPYYVRGPSVCYLKEVKVIYLNPRSVTLQTPDGRAAVVYAENWEDYPLNGSYADVRLGTRLDKVGIHKGVEVAAPIETYVWILKDYPDNGYMKGKITTLKGTNRILTFKYAHITDLPKARRRFAAQHRRYYGREFGEGRPDNLSFKHVGVTWKVTGRLMLTPQSVRTLTKYAYEESAKKPGKKA